MCSDGQQVLLAAGPSDVYRQAGVALFPQSGSVIVFTILNVCVKPGKTQDLQFGVSLSSFMEDKGIFKYFFPTVEVDIV